MKKFLFVSFLMVALALFATSVFAATNAKTGGFDNGISYSVGVADLSSGNTAEVNSDGSLQVNDVGKHIIASQWGSGLVYTGACRVQKVLVQGQAADDYAAVYDAVSATGTAKCDPQSATAKQFVEADLGGAAFSTGIYVHVPNESVLVTVIYDTV